MGRQQLLNSPAGGGGLTLRPPKHTNLLVLLAEAVLSDTWIASVCVVIDEMTHIKSKGGCQVLTRHQLSRDLIETVLHAMKS